MISVNTTGVTASPPSVLTAFDDGNGGFIDSVTGLPLTGTINYSTGVFTITFSESILIQQISLFFFLSHNYYCLIFHSPLSSQYFSSRSATL